MKRSTKITSIIIIFFLVITTVVVARTMIGKHFQKKFGKRPPPGIIVTVVNQKKFQNKIETFGTAVPIRTKAYQIEKFEIISPIKFNQKVKKGDVIAKLKTRNIIAPFDGVIGKRDFSDDIAISASSIVVNIEDNEGLSTDIKFSGNNEKIYKGIIESTASRINTEKRSLAARVRLNNSNLELLPGALLEITIKYNERNSLSIPDTSVSLEGNKVYIYKVDKNNLAKRTEVEIGIRNEGYLEVTSGLNEGERIVAEGLKKVRPNAKIKPIKK